MADYGIQNATHAFNLPSPYQADLAKIAQQQKMAELLQAQSLQPTERYSYKGIEARTPATAGLAKVLQAMGGAYLQKQGLEEQKALGERYRADQMADLTALGTAINAPAVPGSAAVPEMQARPAMASATGNEPTQAMDEEGNPVEMPYSAAKPAVPARQAGYIGPEMIAGMKTREGANQVLALSLAQRQAQIEAERRANEPYTLAEGAARYQPMPGGAAKLIAGGPAEKPFTLSPDQVRYGADGKPLVTAPPKIEPPKIQTIGLGGNKVGDFQYDPDGKIKGERNPTDPRYVLMGTRQGVSNTQQTVINAGPKAFEMELGKLDAEKLGKFRDNAESSQQTLSIIQNLRSAVEQGVYSGGGANLKAEAANIVNGLTGATPKGLVGSQLFNAEASKLVLEKIKTLGANPSNADREFIEKTVPQLGTSSQARDALINFMEQRANQQMDLYKRADTYARANRGFGGFDQFSQPQQDRGVPEANQPAQANQPVRYKVNF